GAPPPFLGSASGRVVPAGSWALPRSSAAFGLSWRGSLVYSSRALSSANGGPRPRFSRRYGSCSWDWRCLRRPHEHASRTFNLLKEIPHGSIRRRFRGAGPEEE